MQICYEPVSKTESEEANRGVGERKPENSEFRASLKEDKVEALTG